MENSQYLHWTDDLDLLERYTLNRIDRPALAPLAEHLRDCEQCQRAVQSELEVLAGIKLAGREKLKGTLRGRLKSEEANIFQRYQLISLAAAVVLIFIGLGLFRLYVGSLEWPVKFSSRKYIVQQNPPDSSATANGTEERQKNRPDKFISQEPVAGQAVPGENSADAHGRRETASNDAGSFQNEIQGGENTRGFWLLGTVIMTPEPAGTTHLSAKAEHGELREKKAEKKFLGQGRVFAIQKDGASQTITLSQRSSRSLPNGGMKRNADDRRIQTLVEKTPQGLNLTLYRDTLFRTSEIQHATIEPVTEDSLIVNLSTERIAYHIPGGWSARQSTKPNIERR